MQAEIGAYDMVLIQFEIPMEVNESVAEIACKKRIPVLVNPSAVRGVGFFRKAEIGHPEHVHANALTQMILPI